MPEVSGIPRTKIQFLALASYGIGSLAHQAHPDSGIDGICWCFLNMNAWAKPHCRSVNYELIEGGPMLE
jgi:hypothetical protein